MHTGCKIGKMEHKQNKRNEKHNIHEERDKGETHEPNIVQNSAGHDGALKE